MPSNMFNNQSDADICAKLDADAPVTEAVDDQPKEMTEDGVKKVIGSLGLEIIHTWYDGNKNRPVFDCKGPDGKTICVWNEPPYEAKVWLKDSDPRNNGLAEDIVSLDELKTKLSSLAGVQPIENADESAMYTFEDSSDSPNDFIIELESKKGWTPDTANSLADFVNNVFDRDGKIEVYYMGSFPDDEGGSIFQIYVDQSNMMAPVQRDAFRMTIQHGIDAIFGNEDDDDAERAFGDWADTAMMDHYDSMNGDIGDIDYESVARNICEKAGMHALAEAITSLYKACHPVMEAVDVPMQIFADYLNQNNINDIDEEKLEQIISNLILGKRITRKEGDEIYNKVMDRVNQQQNAEKPIVTESTDADDDDDDKYDEEFGPASSGNGNSCVCMICGKPCGIGSFRGGSVVCPDCEDRRWDK